MLYHPRMPAVAITGGSRGITYWVCGSERTRIAEIEGCVTLIQIASQDPSKPQGYTRRKLRSAMHEVAKR